jgi:hypothetical protein
LYGDWFGGSSEMRFSDAFAYTPATGRPSFNPITLVGVFPLAISRSRATSRPVQCLPAFLMYFGICILSLCPRDTTGFWVPAQARTPLEGVAPDPSAVEDVALTDVKFAAFLGEFANFLFQTDLKSHQI